MLLTIRVRGISGEIVVRISPRIKQAWFFATSGMEALATLRKRRPDLVLMDVGLPDINGVETTRRLKSVEQFAKIPVVVITGHSEKAVVVESLKASASDKDTE